MSLQTRIKRLENARRREAELSATVEQDESGLLWNCLYRRHPDGKTALFRWPAEKLTPAEWEAVYGSGVA